MFSWSFGAICHGDEELFWESFGCLIGFLMLSLAYESKYLEFLVEIYRVNLMIDEIDSSVVTAVWSEISHCVGALFGFNSESMNCF